MRACFWRGASLSSATRSGRQRSTISFARTTDLSRRLTLILFMGPVGFLDAPIPDLLCMTRWLGHNFCDATFGLVPFFFFGINFGLVSWRWSVLFTRQWGLIVRPLLNGRIKITPLLNEICEVTIRIGYWPCCKAESIEEVSWWWRYFIQIIRIVIISDDEGTEMQTGLNPVTVGRFINNYQDHALSDDTDCPY